MNFGNKLLVVFAVFAGLMGYMTYRCFSVPVDLVSKDYYKDEIAYQQVIDGTKNANALAGKTTIVQLPSFVDIQLPAEMKNQFVKGTILFYCPSNVANDRHFELSTNGDAHQQLDIKKINKGNYTVKIDWNSNKTHYYSEQTVTIL